MLFQKKTKSEVRFFSYATYIFFIRALLPKKLKIASYDFSKQKKASDAFFLSASSDFVP